MTTINPPTSSKMEELLNSPDQPIIPKVGDVIEGTVLSVSTNEVHVDILGFTTGIVRGKEIIDESGTYSNLKVGDKVEATVLELENEGGQMELSFRQAGHQKAWDELNKIMKEGTIVSVPVVDANKGGLMVRVGRIDGFLPVSQLTVEHYPRVEGGDRSKILELLRKFTNQELKVKVIDVSETDSKLIVSEKAAWEEKQQKVISNYKVGDIIEGRITGVVDFGAFIEFGENLEGLVHISELAWQRIDDPRFYVKVGEQIKAKVISIDGSRISLSMKALQTDPWIEASGKYKIGQVVSGVILKVNPFGAFVELDKDIHGLVHISELSNDRISDPASVVKSGEKYKFKILSIEPNNHRLGLSLKAVKDKASKPEVVTEVAEATEQITAPAASPEAVTESIEPIVTPAVEEKPEPEASKAE